MANKKKNHQPTLEYFLRTRKYLVIAIAFGLGAVSFFFVLMFPRVQSIQERRSELNREAKKLSVLEAKNELLANIEGTDLFADREQIHTILPSYKPLLPVIQRLEKISQENQVIVSGLTINPGIISTESADTKVKSSQAKDEELSSLTFQITVVGDIVNINRFLEAIDQLTPITDVSAITLAAATRRGATASESANDARVYETKLELLTYYYIGQPQIQPQAALPDVASITRSMRAEIDNFRIIPIVLPDIDTPDADTEKTSLFE